MSRALAIASFLILVAPFAVAADPVVKSTIGLDEVQDFVSSMIGLPKVSSALEDGDTLTVTVAADSWHGTVHGGAVTMEPGAASSPTHAITVDRNAMLAIANAYDTANTEKLAVKLHYMTATSTRANVQLAIGAIAKTPLDGQLPTHTPAAGDAVDFHGCSGTLVAYGSGFYFMAGACHRAYLVDSIGGVNGILVDWGAQGNGAVALANIGVGTRVFDAGQFTLSSDLIDSGQESADEDGDGHVTHADVSKEKALAKARNATKAIRAAKQAKLDARCVNAATKNINDRCKATGAS